MPFNYFNFMPQSNMGGGGNFFNPMQRYAPPRQYYQPQQQFYRPPPQAAPQARGINLAQLWNSMIHPQPNPDANWRGRFGTATNHPYTGNVGSGMPGTLYYTADRQPHYYT